VPDKETLAAGIARIRRERKTALYAWLVATVVLATVILLSIQFQTLSWVSMLVLAVAFLWAMRAISKRWLEVSGYMGRGEKHPTVNIGSPDAWPTLGPLLSSRAETLAKWVNDDNAWDDEAP